MNKTDMEEDIKMLKELNVEILYFTKDEETKKYVQTIENILADRERLIEENEQLRKRPVFYYDNNRNAYVWCCRCSDNNMSLHMFLENGEIQQYASEHYDKWLENVKEVKQIDVCEFMHEFVKLLIIKANKYDAELEKKDKMIDLMSKYIYKREDNTVNVGKIYCPRKDCDDINRDVDCDTCIKQYFEKKAEGE